MTGPDGLYIGPATLDTSSGRTWRFITTETADYQRARARELLRKWVHLHYIHEGKRSSIEGTLHNVIEDNGRLIVDLILRIT
jgi:hypothetical protein